MSTLATQINSMDDFSLLNEWADIITVNGNNVLYQGLREGNPIVVRRVDQSTISRMTLNAGKMQFNSGGIRCMGPGAYSNQIYACEGQRLAEMKNDEARLSWETYVNLDERLQGVGL